MVDVTVEIGAKIDKLIEGVDGARQQLSRLNDSMNLITGTASKMAEAIGIGLSVAGITAFVERMGDLGLQAERAHAKLGVTGETLSLLRGIAKSTGTDFEGLTLAIERISLNVQRATKDAFNPVNAALKVFGLTTRDLASLPADQYFIKLADAVSKFEPSLNRTNALMAIGGRGVAQILPLLDLGSDGIKKFGEEWKKASSGIDVAKFASTHQAVLLLERSLESIGVKIFAVLQPAINAAIRVMTQWVQSFKEADIRSAISSLIDYTVVAVQATANVIIFLTQAVVDAKESITGLISNIKTYAGYVATILQYAVPGGFAGDLAGKLKSMLTEPVEHATTELDDRSKALVDRVKKFGDELKAAIAENFKSDPHSDTKPAAPAMNLTAKLDADIMKIKLETQRSGLQEQLTQTKNFLDAQVSLERLTAEQRIVAVAGATDIIYQQEVVLLEKERALYPQRSLEWAKVNAEIVKLQQKHSTEMQQLHLQEIVAIKDKYMAVLGTIQNAWDSQIAGLLAKTTSWAQAFKNTLAQLAVEFIKWAEKKVLVYIAGEVAETSAAATGAAARTAVATGEAAAAIGIKKVSMIGSILASAQETFAGVFAFLSPVMGPAAAGPAAASEAVVAAQAALPSFAVGAWNLPSDMIAKVHKGEMIVPAGPADALRNGGGGSVTIYAMDARSVAAWAHDNAGVLTAAVSKYQTNNPSSRGKF